MDGRTTITLHTGSEMPLVGLGTWKLTNNTAETIETALKLGYAMFDTSGDYGTQQGIGEGIKRSGINRDTLFIITKVEETDDAYDATRRNLAELQMEYADLVLIHRPPQTGAGEELWQGSMRAKGEGLAKDIGVSNYPLEALQTLMEGSDEVPTVNQIEWSPFGHSMRMLDFAAQNDIIIQAYSPLTHGKRLDDETVKNIAGKYHKTSAQLLLRWNLQLGTIPLPKANQKKHLEENMGIFDFEISEDDMVALGSLNENYSALS